MTYHIEDLTNDLEEMGRLLDRHMAHDNQVQNGRDIGIEVIYKIRANEEIYRQHYNAVFCLRTLTKELLRELRFVEENNAANDNQGVASTGHN